MAEIELAYEKRLAQETLYFQRMKQAYDEFLAHARHDLLDAHVAAQQQHAVLVHEKEDVLYSTERQKAQLLQYCDYVSSRHQELLESLEQAQVAER